MSASSFARPYRDRHIGPDSSETNAMLERLGYDSVDALMAAALPTDIRPSEVPQLTNLTEPLSEEQAQAQLRRFADANTVLRSFYGQGFAETITPPVIRRGVLEDAGWYTAYTPYQPEISQGRLEALLNFQTMISELTGLPIANASLLDEASAVAEAIGLMRRASRKGNRVLLDDRLHPQVLAVAQARARAIDVDSVVTNLASGIAGDDIIGAVIAYPGTEGDITNPEPLITAVHERGGLATVVTDPLALVTLREPGAMGADIAVGSSQRFGVPMFFGGPHAAYMAVTDKLKRQMPGRVVGVSVDADGNPAYRLALQTREQHIRRERATSNICTAQALLAVTASMYAVWHGPDGLKHIAWGIHELAVAFADAVRDAGGEVAHDQFFDTVTVVAPGQAAELVAAAAAAGYLVRELDDDHVTVAFGESATWDDVAELGAVFGTAAISQAEPSTVEAAPTGEPPARRAIPDDVLRDTEPLTHRNFTTVHSETQMMRYLRELADKDLALDRTMIPLGSCTMKLTPTAGMEAISWPALANMHPFAPVTQTGGWRALIAQLEDWLAQLTGYAQVSVQPNAGSQGELAGLLAIRGWHLANGDTMRDICLIPQSAHGTNAASAALANLRVVVVATAEDGSIDLADLDNKLEQHAGQVAAIMITYPSTHGVYEDTVRTVCDKVHAAGGQVYIDGANLNALTGWAQPGQFGGDVSHLNLHKTFTIPHGGGGPGVGPVCVAKHLVPYLPADPNAAADGETHGGVPVTGTRWGSAGVLPISWAYIAMMGPDGLRDATAWAVLAANYLAAELSESYPVLYTGANGLVAHECIIDLRALTKETGVTAADVAKRLVDFGFHAPTLAFPVPGTLMIEPTESEDLGELDRFIEAMRTIRQEIAEISDGAVKVEESVLRRAPFTAYSVTSSNWEETFSREQAAFPVPGLVRRKYFPPVRRIDDAFGDRNFVCTCPPPEAFDSNYMSKSDQSDQ
ncbi:aminomethyl-transferring glycine dehydrogenase [Corynebacterium ulceribovis]|uniref:aminomethyl-transferring glycine dehydrogenase n=1 Tax=Corynebacterium ulceribovis TaxID=487732 RepID=UPI000371111E|nr:aminomethyl-transferring glycine dehydrogenase [Corynebacterium ulceribovis]